MTDPHPLAFLRLPFGWLAALDSRGFHYAVQPVHYLVRLVHILAMAAFFGAVAILDLRLMGWGRALPLRPLAQLLLPWLYVGFAASCVTGMVLFFYDPVHVGSHGYFVPKMLSIVSGLVVAGTYRRTGFRHAFADAATMPRSAKLAAATSLLLWTGVVVCSCLDAEGVPKVLLR